LVASSLGSVLAVTSPPTNSRTSSFNSRITDKVLRVGVNYKFDPTTSGAMTDGTTIYSDFTMAGIVTLDINGQQARSAPSPIGRGVG